jgi:hypothetical protein
MSSILKNRSFQLSIILTFIFFGIGIAFLFFGLSNFSWILFAALPVLLGISLGVLPNIKMVMLGGILAALIFLYSLITFGLSGFICVVMSLPIIIPLMFVGSIITHFVRRYKEIKSDKFSVLLVPIIPFLIAAPTEHFLNTDNKAIISVTTEQVFNYTPAQVYDAIKSVDTLDAEKPWLMAFDLPVPTKCVLEKEEVGGIRTCYFKKGNLSNAEFGSGTITEKITELEKGKILKMDVTNYNLIGRKWLGFKEAIYYFDKVGNNSCKLTRVTTYTSVLTPRFYWQPMEELGIRQEHEYVFNNLKKDLEKLSLR